MRSNNVIMRLLLERQPLYRLNCRGLLMSKKASSISHRLTLRLKQLSLGLALGITASASAWAGTHQDFESNNPFARMGYLLDRPATAATAVGAQQVWGQVFQLLRDANGVPSKARFEGAFGAPMRESLIGGDATFYGLNSGQGAYFDVGLSWYRGDKMQSRARSAHMVDEQQACVSAAAASQDLMALGWMPGQYDGRNGNFYSFAKRKGQERIFLYVTQGCVNRVSMSVA